jgi:hypothetical protein
MRTEQRKNRERKEKNEEKERDREELVPERKWKR